MGQIILDKLPRMQSSIKDIAKFRGAASSHNYNQLQESLFFDITNMFNIMSEYENRLKETSELQAIDNIYTQMKISELELENRRLQSEINHFKFYDARRTIVDVFNAQAVTVATSPLVNRLFNQINLKNHSTTSKLYLYDEGVDLITIPSSLRYDLYPPASDGITDNDLKLAFNGNDNEFFVRKIVSEDSSPKELEIVIELPDNIISSRDINSIEICPYPYNAVDILDIEYQLNGQWMRVPGFSSHKDYIKDININEYGDIIDKGFIKDAENVKLCFYKIAMARLKITLRQRTYICENNKYTFYIGLKKLNVDCENVATNYCEFSSDIIFKEKEPKLITSLKPYFNNDNILSDQSDEKKTLMSYEFYTVDTDGAMEYMKNSLPIVCHDKHYVIITKMYYDRINDINPSLAYLDINYELTDRVENDDCVCHVKNIELIPKSITIPYNQEAKIETLSASCDTVSDNCPVEYGRSGTRTKHDNSTEPHYKYKIKSASAECYITEENKIVAKTDGMVTVTVEVYFNDKLFKKDFEIMITKENPPTYTVTYNTDGDGKIAGIALQSVPYREDAVPVEAIPDDNANFIGWSDGYAESKRQEKNVRSDLTITAKFEIKEHTVTFMAYQTVPVLETVKRETVKYGRTATPPTIATINGYRFIRWDKPYNNITDDITISALYVKQYTVTFIDYNGEIIARRVVDSGGKATPPPNPQREGYDFIGWDKGFENVNADINVTAQYRLKTYTVQFKDWNGTLIVSRTVNHGSSATAPPNPSRAGYTFKGWDRDFSNVKSDIVVTAQYDINTYIITPSSSVGGSISPNTPQTVTHSNAITFTFTADIGYVISDIVLNGTSTGIKTPSYTISNVSSNQTIRVNFAKKQYSVQFKNWDNTILKTETVTHGASATAPANPTRPGYDFKGWDKAFTNVTSDLIVTALFEITDITHDYDWHITLRWGITQNDIDIYAYLYGTGIAPGEKVFYGKKNYTKDENNQVWLDRDYTSHTDENDYDDKPEIMTILGKPCDKAEIRIVNRDDPDRLTGPVTVTIENPTLGINRTFTKNGPTMPQLKECAMCEINLTDGTIRDLNGTVLPTPVTREIAKDTNTSYTE